MYVCVCNPAYKRRASHILKGVNQNNSANESSSIFNFRFLKLKINKGFNLFLLNYSTFPAPRKIVPKLKQVQRICTEICFFFFVDPP